ncbi:HEPN domain-containing protein, partial [Ferroglobus sp.]|uniref:HEPN domain-containing protein n=1 Tax=Ferroglobus sp. TaxID=2614230 RepID=UPI0025BB674B
LRKRAVSFLEAAEERLKAGSYDISCFLAEQAVQLYLKSVILEFSGEIPRTHSIRKLLSILSNLLNIKFDFDRKELIFLEDAYIKARYLSSEYGEEDAKNAISTARRLMSVVDRARKEKS